MEGFNQLITGSLQKKHGEYYAVLNLKDKTGKRYQKWIKTGISENGKKHDAEKILAKQIKEFSENKACFCGNDVASYFEEWIKSADRDIRQNTYRGYCGTMRNHIIPYFKEHKIKLQDLTAIDLEDYYYSKMRPESNLVTGGALSPTTIRHHHQNISRALSDAVRRGLIPANPASAARLPKQKKFRPEFCNLEQIDQLLVLFENNPIELPVRLSAIYGFRRSEVLGLKWKNIDFINKTITVSETLQQNVGGNYTDITKTESSYRTLPMTDRVYALLQNQVALQSQRKELLGYYYIKSDYVCTMPNGKVINPNYLTRIFHSIVEHSTLPHIRFHDLRHSTASNLLNAGFSVVQVQEWLGHSSAETTLRFYSHVDKSSKIAIAESLNRMDRRKDAEKEAEKERIVSENSSVKLLDG